MFWGGKKLLNALGSFVVVGDTTTNSIDSDSTSPPFESKRSSLLEPDNVLELQDNKLMLEASNVRLKCQLDLKCDALEREMVDTAFATNALKKRENLLKAAIKRLYSKTDITTAEWLKREMESFSRQESKDCSDPIRKIEKLLGVRPLQEIEEELKFVRTKLKVKSGLLAKAAEKLSKKGIAFHERAGESAVVLLTQKLEQKSSLLTKAALRIEKRERDIKDVVSVNEALIEKIFKQDLEIEKLKNAAYRAPSVSEEKKAIVELMVQSQRDQEQIRALQESLRHKSKVAHNSVRHISKLKKKIKSFERMHSSSTATIELDPSASEKDENFEKEEDVPAKPSTKELPEEKNFPQEILSQGENIDKSKKLTQVQNKDSNEDGLAETKLPQNDSRNRMTPKFDSKAADTPNVMEIESSKESSVKEIEESEKLLQKNIDLQEQLKDLEQTMKTVDVKMRKQDRVIRQLRDELRKQLKLNQNLQDHHSKTSTEDKSDDFRIPSTSSEKSEVTAGTPKTPKTPNLPPPKPPPPPESPPKQSATPIEINNMREIKGSQKANSKSELKRSSHSKSSLSARIDNMKETSENPKANSKFEGKGKKIHRLSTRSVRKSSISPQNRGRVIYEGPVSIQPWPINDDEDFSDDKKTWGSIFTRMMNGPKTPVLFHLVLRPRYLEIYKKKADVNRECQYGRIPLWDGTKRRAELRVATVKIPDRSEKYVRLEIRANGKLSRLYLGSMAVARQWEACINFHIQKSDSKSTEISKSGKNEKPLPSTKAPIFHVSSIVGAVDKSSNVKLDGESKLNSKKPKVKPKKDDTLEMEVED
eukprot:CAMPEP_0167760168 /NCGR_PEP_ID=MMETSP0110_2-20121227/11437_1 /TAXON_ID=629695 /ORGANISM="Gymnochlora sp., Strain CCMP2014" /LENGTH=817 /DNA_ID=CAMNT_0007646651 /DNA_START=42 /DNA_END=2492 /DNA_ORIENTATION=-